MPFIQFQFRRGTSAEWSSQNTTLAAGEIGIETNTNQFKLGNGSTPWNSLAYGGIQGVQGIQGTPGGAVAQGWTGAQGTSGTNGTQGTQGTQGIEGTQGIQGISSRSGIMYTFSTTTTDSDPTSGYFRYNNSQSSSVTFIYLSVTDKDSNTVTNFIESLDDSTSTTKGQLIVYNKTFTTFNIYSISGTIQNASTYRKIPVTYLTGNSPFSTLTNNEEITLVFNRTGDIGSQGIQGVQGDLGIQGVQGIQGEPGIQGLSGSAVAQGFEGAQGIQGVQGIQGIQGIPGTGTQGTTGSGSQGTQGIQGLQGIQGASIQGIQGPSGAGGGSFANPFPDILQLSNTTDSSGTGTGALVVTGGVGIAKGLNVGGIVGLGITNGTFGDLVLLGFGDNRLLYNNSSSIATLKTSGAVSFKLNSAGVGGITILGTGEITVDSTTASTSTTTGALRVSGGLGIVGNTYAANIYTNGVQITPGQLPQNSQSTSYTLQLTDAGKHLLHPSSDTTARTWIIPQTGTGIGQVNWPIGTTITFVNQNGAGTLSIQITSDTLRLAVTGATGTRTLAANGVATCIKISATEWIISGVGIS